MAYRKEVPPRIDSEARLCRCCGKVKRTDEFYSVTGYPTLTRSVCKICHNEGALAAQRRRRELGIPTRKHQEVLRRALNANW